MPVLVPVPMVITNAVAVGDDDHDHNDHHHDKSNDEDDDNGNWQWQRQGTMTMADNDDSSVLHGCCLLLPLASLLSLPAPLSVILALAIKVLIVVVVVVVAVAGRRGRGRCRRCRSSGWCLWSCSWSSGWCLWSCSWLLVSWYTHPIQLLNLRSKSRHTPVTPPYLIARPVLASTSGPRRGSPCPQRERRAACHTRRSPSTGWTERPDTSPRHSRGRLGSCIPRHRLRSASRGR